MSEQYCLFDDGRVEASFAPAEKPESVSLHRCAVPLPLGKGGRGKEKRAEASSAPAEKPGSVSLHHCAVPLPLDKGGRDEEERTETAHPPAFPERGRRLFKIGLTDGRDLIVRQEKSMFELAGELRSRAVVRLTDAEGKVLQLRSEDVRSIEHYRGS